MCEKSVLGLSPKTAAALCYVFGTFSGIVVLLMEKENKFVRFHALQSIFWFLMLLVFGSIFFYFLLMLTPILGFVFWLVTLPAYSISPLFYIASKFFLIWKAYQGTTYKTPIVGEEVWEYVNKK